MSILVLPEKIFLFGFIIHLQVVLRLISFLPKFAESPNELRKWIHEHFYYVLISKHLIFKNIAQANDNSREFIVAFEVLFKQNNLLN